MMSLDKDQNTIVVEKYNSLRDINVDLTSRLGISRHRPELGPSKLIYMGDEVPVQLTEGTVPAASISYYELSVEWGKLSKKVRRQEVTKTEKWGGYTVKFVTYWFVTYNIAVPKDIIGG